MAIATAVCMGAEFVIRIPYWFSKGPVFDVQTDETVTVPRVHSLLIRFTLPASRAYRRLMRESDLIRYGYKLAEYSRYEFDRWRHNEERPLGAPEWADAREKPEWPADTTYKCPYRLALGIDRVVLARNPSDLPCFWPTDKGRYKLTWGFFRGCYRHLRGE